MGFMGGRAAVECTKLEEILIHSRAPLMRKTMMMMMMIMALLGP